MAKVLVIDDDNLVRLTICKVLEKSGLIVAEAGDGQAGLEMAQSIQPDLVITDIVMPNMDGLAMIQEIRKTLPKAKIIAVSGGGRTGDMELLDIARTVGAAAVLKKPIERTTLLRAIEELYAG